MDITTIIEAAAALVAAVITAVVIPYIKSRTTAQQQAEHGITLDEERIDALIEAAVYELNHGVLKEGAGNE